MPFRRLASLFNTLVLRGAGAGVAVLFAIMVSRYYPTDSAARFFLLFNICTIAAVCFRWGLDEVIVRRVANLPLNDVVGASRHLVWLSHRRVTIWFSACLFLAFISFHPVFDALLVSIDSVSLVLSLCAAVFISLTACAARILQGRGYTNRATFILNIAVPGLSLIGLFLLANTRSANEFDLILLYLCVAFSVYLIAVVMAYGNPFSLLAAGYRLNFFNAESSAANKLGVVVLAQQVVGWTALLIVPFAYGGDAYKGFVVVQKVATLISLTMLAVNFTFSRSFASIYAAGRFGELRRLVLYSVLTIVIASLVISALLMLFRYSLFSYAQIDTDMTSLLIILMASQFFFSIAALFSLVLSMAHDDNYLFVAQAAVNGVGALLFMGLAFTGSLEVASISLGASYLCLSLVLGRRVRCITGKVVVAKV